MKAVILAGGKGTRLRDVIKDIPKPMAPVNGRPFLEYLILQLIRWNIKDVILSIGYKGEAISSYFKNGSKWGVRIEYSEETAPLGTGGALKKASGMTDDSRLVVMNGDSFLDMDFEEFIKCNAEKNATAGIGLVYAAQAGRYGKVETDETGAVVSFSEKGDGCCGYVNGGIYIFSREIIGQIPDGNVSLEKDVLPLLISQGLYGTKINGFFIDIGIPEDYLRLCNNPELLAVSFAAASRVGK
ncbi:MAG: nucleotidyltransferase family protein [Nitrospirae bacterium]|nr:nucleotidyltransferase family protein [Nitrospirota bacterium]